MKPAARHVSRFLSSSLFSLPLGCVVALVWANTLPEPYFRFRNTLAFVVNDIGFAFFIGLIMKEVIEATLPGGPLHTWRRAAFPLAAAIGGALAPIAAYLLFLRATGEVMLTPAWEVTCAVDIAGCYTVGRLVFGRHPAVSVLLLLAIAIDGLGLAALAVWHPTEDAHVLQGLGLMTLAIGAAIGLRRAGVRNFWWFLIGPGVLSWWALFLGGVQPAFALVPILPFMKHATRDTGLFVEPSAQAHDTLSDFERSWERPVQIVLLLFGFVNAGVQLHGLEEGMWAVPVAVLVGRPLGVLAAAWLAVAAGLHLPHNVHWRDVTVIGCITSIGLLMALFFVSAAMPGTGALPDELRTGALLTTAGIIISVAAARILRVGRFATHVTVVPHAGHAIKESNLS